MAKAFRFGMVGVLSSAVFSIVTAAFVGLLSVDPKLASVGGYVASMPVNFVFNRRFSFRSDSPLFSDLIRFIGLHSVNILLTALSMGAIVDFLGLHYVFGMMAAVIMVPVVNFFAMNLWVFRRRRHLDSAIKPR
ncbi:GtrA family protein [Bosea sp. 685]|uniref:GtrA family protein n=1 Tax=Bosea sp. 685 TaxID=3080057 RepID=UPI002892D5FB|nr:GtrA family protein [Bosea sp. 685]WNJ90045.1 GtrA family protein [Bosea sp. 685]